MKKKVMSIIAAAAVMVSSSPIYANALYKEVISKQDYSDYVKVDFMSDEKADVYIYNGVDIDSNEPYRRNAIREEKKNDRIYLNVKEGMTVSELGGLLKEFRTENGDSLQIHANNTFNKEYSYYITPSVFKENEPIKQISSNDARKIKELLAKDNSATEMFYSTDVCNPANGAMDLTFFYYPDQYYKEKDTGKKEDIKAETEQIVSDYVSENNLDVTLEFIPKGENTAHISIVPNTNLSLNEMLLIVDNIIDNCNIYPEVGWQVSTNEDFSAIDLLNAVDGDTNCDDQMDLSDAVMIMQALANPNKYGIDGTAEHHLTKQGKFNGDINGDGLTVGDAQAIQRKLLGLTDTVEKISALPKIKLYHSVSATDTQYTEMKVDEVVSIETNYDPLMSDWSGIGILLEFESKDCPITLSTNEGHFTTWDIEAGSGPIENVGKTYNVGNEGYIFWTPDNLHYDENFVSEILIMEDNSGKNKVLGTIVVNQNNQRTLSAVLKEKNDTEVTNNVVESIIAPKIRLYKSNSPEELQYTEMEKGEVVSIETDYNPLMSDWSGIGILLEFESKDYPITLSTNEGHFTTWDKEEGSGIVTNVGKEYDIGNSGYVFWTPDNLSYSEDFESEIIIVGENNGKSVEVGKIVININDKHTLSAVLK